MTRLSGTAQAATTSYTYDPSFSQVTSVTDPLSHTWTLGLDSHGNVSSVTDPLGHQTFTATYDSEGRVAARRDGVNNTTTFAYTGADLVAESDPLGNTSFLFTDAAGRPVWTQDPLGNATNLAYSPLDDLTQIMDEDGNLTLFSYDADRNLLSVTDANGGTTAYGYDSMDRRTSRTDPLGHAEASQYDGNGNLTLFTDRRGKIAVYQYDGLNRRTFAGFGKNGSSYESSINFTWDGGDRMTQAVDSIAGTIARSYDGFDDLLSETTPPGSVSYQYDLARRRTSMQVAGQPAISYTWDIANRLNGISQSTMPNATSVGFAYDSADRRTSLTLPNGIVLSYAYDNDSRVTAMSWMAALNQVGDLEYSYDADGHVIEKTGSFASTGIPSAVSGNTFNLANEMTAFNGTPLSYDLNGNLTNDGTNTYTWDARNHLFTLTGSGMLATSAGFIYDALGRRSEKTINQQTTAFLYDNLNPVQELAPSGLGQFAATANMLTGLGIDEFFQRMDANGAQSFVSDPLGSTLALTTPVGSISTSYTYEPFGKLSNPSATDTNPFQFTGRENDGTELDYYRARYYDPSIQRFISQDPLRIRDSETNLYAYVLNNPLGLIDPTGTQEVIIPPPGDVIIPPEGTLLEPPGTDLDPFPFSPSCSPKKDRALDKCLAAAGGGDWLGFCGSLLNKQLQAQCYSEQLESQTHKEGWCHRNWPRKDWSGMI